MWKRFWVPTKGGLLSYSAMSKFLECPRKYAWQYIDKVEIEQQEGDGLLKGRAFHEIVETGDEAKAAEHIQDQSHQALVRAASRKYREMADRGDFPPATHRELKMINEERQFFGYVDEMTVTEDGLWMVGEMKTGSKFDPLDYAMAEIKHQTALYKGMAKPFCSEHWLSVNDFAGLSFKKIIFPGIKPLKGRGKNAVPEKIEDFEKRAYDGTKIFHKIVKVKETVEADAMFTFQRVLESIDHLGPNPGNYLKNTSACNHPWFKICPFFVHCHGLDISLQDDSSSDVDMNELPE